jgi:hypothetical protein
MAFADGEIPPLPISFSIKCASTTYMNPFDMLRCEINALMNYANFI